MRKLIPILLLVTAVLLLTESALAQNSSPAIASAPAPPASLANLPEADALFYLSPQRVLTVAAPRVMTAADLEKMRGDLDELKTHAGIDPATINYIALAVRFRKPTADLKLNPPELLIVANGDFSADGLMLLARQGLQGKLR